jgi:hypothetical protein
VPRRAAERPGRRRSRPTTSSCPATSSEAPEDFELVGEPFTEEPYGIGVPEGQEDFCEFVNETLAEAAEDGSLQEAFDATAGEVIEKEITPLPEPAAATADAGAREEPDAVDVVLDNLDVYRRRASPRP